MYQNDENNGKPGWSSLPDSEMWDDTEPERPIYLKDVYLGRRITTYVPGNPETTRHFEVVAPQESEDQKGDQVISCRDLDTGKITTSSTATFGLSLSPDGHRYCWAIPYDEDA